jgi:2-oxoglutarate dehydrogenase E2 component (dihydrolipoamide succinyltransferase)
MDALTMSTPVTLPALGESVTEGTVVRWLKHVGDTVALDEPLLEVSTDKVDTEIPSPAAGVVLEISAAEDDLVEVGAQLAVIGATTEVPPSGPTPVSVLTAEPTPVAAPATTVVATGAWASTPEQRWETSVSTPDGDYLSPVVRALAAEHDIELTSVHGSGGGGRIRKQDVLDAVAAKTSSTAPAAAASAASVGTTEKLSRLRQVIATRMVASLRTSAQLTQVMEVDVTRMARLRESVKADFQAREGVKLTYLPFFAKAAIDALADHPKLNASIDTNAGEVTYHADSNVSFAVDTERGLLIPVVKNAAGLSIAELARSIADLADRTRTNRITPDDLAGGTFTITNLGSFGALFDTPIINQPQVAILGPGAVVKRPVVIDDPDFGETIAVRHMVYLSLSYDHRLVDGADAGRYLSDVKTRLEEAQFAV